MLEQLATSTGPERIRILTGIAHHYLHNEEWDKSKLHFQSALDAIEIMNCQIPQDELGRIHAGLSYLYWKKKEYEISISEGNLAIEILTIAKSRDLLTAMRHLGVVLIESGACVSGLECFAEVNKLKDFDEDEILVAKDNYYIGNAYEKLENFESALQYLNIALEIFKKRHLIWMTMLCEKSIANCNLNLDLNSKALHYAKKAFETACFLEGNDEIIETALLISKVYEENNQSDHAIFQLKSAKSIYLKTIDEPLLEPLIKLEKQLADLLEKNGEKDESIQIRSRLGVIQNEGNDYM